MNEPLDRVEQLLLEVSFKALNTSNFWNSIALIVILSTKEGSTMFFSYKFTIDLYISNSSFIEV